MNILLFLNAFSFVSYKQWVFWCLGFQMTYVRVFAYKSIFLFSYNLVYSGQLWAWRVIHFSKYIRLLANFVYCRNCQLLLPVRDTGTTTRKKAEILTQRLQNPSAGVSVEYPAATLHYFKNFYKIFKCNNVFNIMCLSLWPTFEHFPFIIHIETHYRNDMKTKKAADFPLKVILWAWRWFIFGREDMLRWNCRIHSWDKSIILHFTPAKSSWHFLISVSHTHTEHRLSCMLHTNKYMDSKMHYLVHSGKPLHLFRCSCYC